MRDSHVVLVRKHGHDDIIRKLLTYTIVCACLIQTLAIAEIQAVYVYDVEICSWEKIDIFDQFQRRIRNKTHTMHLSYYMDFNMPPFTSYNQTTNSFNTKLSLVLATDVGASPMQAPTWFTQTQPTSWPHEPTIPYPDASFVDAEVWSTGEPHFILTYTWPTNRGGS